MPKDVKKSRKKLSTKQKAPNRTTDSFGSSQCLPVVSCPFKGKVADLGMEMEFLVSKKRL